MNTFFAQCNKYFELLQLEGAGAAINIGQQEGKAKKLHD
jgi:hypothetical protein